MFIVQVQIVHNYKIKSKQNNMENTKEKHAEIKHIRNPYKDYQMLPIDLDDPEMPELILKKAYLCIEKFPPSLKNLETRGIYAGPSGLIYMLLKLIRCDIFSKEKQHLTTVLIEYTKGSMEYCKRTRDDIDTCSLMLGRGGMYLLCAASYHVLGQDHEFGECIDHYYYGSTQCAPIDFLPNGGDEFANGRAGYIAGALWTNYFVKKQVFPKDLLIPLVHTIIESGREYSKSKNSPCPLLYAYFNNKYIGFLHGTSAILLVILCFSSYLSKSVDAEHDVQESVDYILQLQRRNGHFPGKLEDFGKKPEYILQWCNGSPGVIYLMMKAYMRWMDDKYLNSCKKSADLIWNKGLIKKGPGLCHGVAGNAYSFLALYRMTQDLKYLYRAYKFAEFLMTDDFQEQASPLEKPYNLMEGWAGTVCFLIEMFYGSKEAMFPFVPLFDDY